MSFTPEQSAMLAAPLDKSAVKEREQAGRRLSYVEAWHAIAEANRIFGFGGWTRETVRLEETNRDLVGLTGKNGPYTQWRVGFLAVVRVRAGDVVREGTGFGSGMSKPEALGEAIESAAKEAESDAMKRALMTFGNPFGLALYDKTQANVSDGSQRSPDAVRMATETIKMCKTLDAVKGWAAKNSDSLKASLHPDDYDEIARILKAHANTLKVMAETNAQRASELNGAREQEVFS